MRVALLARSGPNPNRALGGERPQPRRVKAFANINRNGCRDQGRTRWVDADGRDKCE